MIGRVLRVLPLALAVACLVLTVLPVWRTDLWWVRYLDYPRLETTAFMLGLAVLLVPLRRRIAGGRFALALLAVAVGWNAVKLAPYVAPAVAAWPAPAVEAGACPADRRLRVLAANVQMTNERDDRLLRIVREADPDVAWFQETDADWEARLAPLADAMPYGASQAQANYFGVHLFSRLPLEDAKVHFLTHSRNPSVFATVVLPSGERARLYAVHPRPPQVGQSTAERDAQLMATALAANAETLPGVVMGDFNAVPWEAIVERLRRIGGFRDPRVGRGLFITWNAHEPLLKWPLDHVLPDADWTLARLAVLPAFGSDHRPVLAELCLRPAPGRPSPDATAEDLARARATVANGWSKADGPNAAAPPRTEAGPGDDDD